MPRTKTPGPLLVGLGYRRGVGKTTVADYLVARWGFKECAFADAIKRAAQTIFQLTDAQLYGRRKDDPDEYWWGLTARELVQRLGVEACRVALSDDIWVKALFRGLDLEKGCHVVSDVRMLNEAEAVKERGGWLVRIDRKVEGEIAGEDHATERELAVYEGWDHVIGNDGTLDGLSRQIDALVRRLALVNSRLADVTKG